MSPHTARILAALCLIVLPFIYILGVKVLHDGHPTLARIIIMGWMLISLAIGVASALTFKNQVFGFNSGSLLAYSVPIITIAFTLQILEYRAGGYLMYALFAIAFASGTGALIKYLRGE